jgi:hypothetical protein
MLDRTNTPILRTREGLEALPAGAVIRDADGDIGTVNLDSEDFTVAGFDKPLNASFFRLPVHWLNAGTVRADSPEPLTAQVHQLVAEARSLAAQQESELDELRSENGGVPEENLHAWDQLRFDKHAYQDSELLERVIDRLAELFGEPKPVAVGKF